jgi:hypothetical protein
VRQRAASRRIPLKKHSTLLVAGRAACQPYQLYVHARGGAETRKQDRIKCKSMWHGCICNAEFKWIEHGHRLYFQQYTDVKQVRISIWSVSKHDRVVGRPTDCVKHNSVSHCRAGGLTINLRIFWYIDGLRRRQIVPEAKQSVEPLR